MKFIKKRFWIVLVTVGILTIFYFYNRNTNQPVGPLLKLEQTLSFDTKGYRDQWVLIHFWAKWCEPCVEEIPDLIYFAERVSIPIIAISLDESLGIAQTLLPGPGKTLPPNVTLVLDSEHRFAEVMGSFQYPETYLINRQGDIVQKWVGAQKWNKPEVIDNFKENLN